MPREPSLLPRPSPRFRASRFLRASLVPQSRRRQGHPRPRPPTASRLNPRRRKPLSPSPSAPRKPRMAAGRRIGQVLVDLGFIDEDQLWDILDEAKNNSQPTGQVAVGRGLITEEQLLQALAEQHSAEGRQSRTMSRPTPEAATLVPETMATVYKILPLTYQGQASDRRHRRPQQHGRPRRPAQLPRRQGSTGHARQPERHRRGHDQSATPARKRASSTSSTQLRERPRPGRPQATRPASTWKA